MILTGVEISEKQYISTISNGSVPVELPHDIAKPTV